MQIPLSQNAVGCSTDPMASALSVLRCSKLPGQTPPHWHGLPATLAHNRQSPSAGIATATYTGITHSSGLFVKSYATTMLHHLPASCMQCSAVCAAAAVWWALHWPCNLLTPKAAASLPSMPHDLPVMRLNAAASPSAIRLLKQTQPLLNCRYVCLPAGLHRCQLLLRDRKVTRTAPRPAGQARQGVIPANGDQQNDGSCSGAPTFSHALMQYIATYMLSICPHPAAGVGSTRKCRLMLS